MEAQEKCIWDYLASVFSGKDEYFIVEVGAHWGEDTHRILSLVKSGSAVIFEPDPRNIEIIKNQRFSHPVTLVEKAIGSSDGLVTLYLSDGQCMGNRMTGANSILPPREVEEKFSWISFNDAVSVQCTTLDNYFSESVPRVIDFMWCDMQGAEFMMIQSAFETLSMTRYLYMEYSDIELYEGQKTLDECLSLLNETGEWQLVKKFPTDVLLKNNTFAN